MGAVGAALRSLTDGNTGAITQKIKPAIDKARLLNARDGNSTESVFYEKVAHLNIENSVTGILASSSYIWEQNHKGNVGIIAAYYDTATGEVIFNELVDGKNYINAW